MLLRNCRKSGGSADVVSLCVEGDSIARDFPGEHRSPSEGTYCEDKEKVDSNGRIPAVHFGNEGRHDCHCTDPPIMSSSSVVMACCRVLL